MIAGNHCQQSNQSSSDDSRTAKAKCNGFASFCFIYMQKPCPQCRALKYSALLTYRRFCTPLWSHSAPLSWLESASYEWLKMIMSVCASGSLDESKSLMYRKQYITPVLDTLCISLHFAQVCSRTIKGIFANRDFEVFFRWCLLSVS